MRDIDARTHLESEFQEHGQIVARTDHNIWHYTHPRSLAMCLWGQPAWMRDMVWALECTKTFTSIPAMPRIVSASEMAKVWGVSHVTAKKLLRGDWEWIPISARHFVHTSQIAHPLHYRIMRVKAPLQACKAITRLAEYPINLPAFRQELIKYLGYTAFSALVTMSVLKETRTLFGRRKVYYVASHY